MNIVEQQQLWNKLEEFQFENGFVDRLSEEKGIPRSFAWVIAQEYRRFIFLSATLNTMVTPSYWIDQCWHLHLVYTDSYWNKMCKDIIGKPIHHHPGTGKVGEEQKFVEAFHRTRVGYKLFFGTFPSNDAWGGERIKEKFTWWGRTKINVKSKVRWFSLSSLFLLPGCSEGEILFSAVIIFVIILLLAIVFSSKGGGKGGSKSGCSSGFVGCGSSCGHSCSSCGSSCGD